MGPEKPDRVALECFHPDRVSCGEWAIVRRRVAEVLLGFRWRPCRHQVLRDCRSSRLTRHKSSRASGGGSN